LVVGRLEIDPGLKTGPTLSIERDGVTVAAVCRRGDGDLLVLSDRDDLSA
jgi:hypothetical protein